MQRESAYQQQNHEHVQPTVSLPHICLGQRAGQSHLLWSYVQPAVNCQPSYCWGSRKSRPRSIKTSNSNMVFKRPQNQWGSGLSVCTATPLCMWQGITMPPDSYLNIQIVIAKSRENRRRPSIYSIKCATSSKLST